MQTNQVKIKDIIKGRWYNLSGDIKNGNYITHEEVTRRITRITEDYIFCECGRKFIINRNLKITEPSWQI